MAGLLAASLVTTTLLNGSQLASAEQNTIPVTATDPKGHENRLGWRGRLISAVPLETLTAEQVVTELESDEDGDWDTSRVRFGLRTYRLVYGTVDATGRPTLASGLFVLPDNGMRRLRTVSYTHGTEFFRGDAPSTSDDVWGPAPAMTFAAAGYAAVAPDYLGLGVGPGPHPYVDVPSLTTASMDMLRAARRYALGNGRQLDRQVFVTGFSQGASAALGLARALEDGADSWFRLAAVAPISGPYHLREAEIPALLDGRLNPMAAVIYVSYGLVALDRQHDVYGDPADVFQAPYASVVEELYDGDHTADQVVSALPGSVDELLTERGFEMLANPTGDLAAALDVADSTCQWHPEVPVRLYLTRADEQVVADNTDLCVADFAAHGAQPDVVDLGVPVYQESPHLGTNVAGTAEALRWFDSL